MSWKGRLKAKFAKKGLPTSPRIEASPTSIIPHTRAAPDPTTPPPNFLARLWNQAYEQAKTSDSSTVDAYEKILSARLSEQDADASHTPHSADLASQQNEIAQDAGKRRIQMQQLVQNGLRRTEKDAKVKEGMEDSIQAAMAVKEVVNKAIQASPEAAVAWVGVCFALEILMNPLTQASSNRQGIAYVVSRMDWYWNLSSLLLDENMAEADSPGLRDELQNVVAQLYAKLLLYQMKSVCYYHRGRLSVFLRDLIKLENWDGELSDIQAAEAAVQADSAQYNTLSIRTRLSAIAEAAKSQNAKLDSISSAIREQTKLQESMHETSADNKCLADLRLTDPRDDKKRIEETHGGLLKDSYRWILENPNFRQWRDNPQNQLLWVKADPGKGKTMLLCGIIDELQNSMGATGLLSYFFCQATDSRIRSAVAVLRGLLYLLVSQQPSLISHVRKKYDQAGKALFEDANAWVALTEIFASILQDPSLECTYLIVDALDECITDRPKLLDFIAQKSSTSSYVKWIVSSRNWQDIEEQLAKVGHKVRLSLELNAQSVSSAVSSFIQHRVFQLAELKTYDDKTRDAVLNHLSSNANGTFLWVALVCESLKDVPRWKVIKKLHAFPPSLNSLYERMMQQIRDSEDANVCKHILALAAIAYQPTTLEELLTLVEELEDITKDPESIRDIISLCGSFLTLQKDTVYFVHQSAKDFLSTKAFHDIFPFGVEDAHYMMLSRSLQAMSTSKLHRDMYDLRKLGCPAEQIIQPNPDPLVALRYSCIYWIDHLCAWSRSASADSSADLRDGGAVHEFLRKKYLYWLEALSLCKSLSKGVISITKLETLIKGRADAASLIKLVQDARRFIMAHKWIIENSPLQAYASALIFSPVCSLVRRLFREEPPWITIKPSIGDTWSACLQTLEGHSNCVKSVAFSHDSTSLASASWDNTVKVWDASSGECLSTLSHSDVASVAFSHDSTRLASASWDCVKVWNASSGECLLTFGYGGTLVVFSYNSTRLASASYGSTVKIWDASSGNCLSTFEAFSDSVNAVALSYNLTWLALGLCDGTVKVWDCSSGKCLLTLKGHSGFVIDSLAFSYDSTRLASGSEDGTVKVWDASSGECLSTLSHGYRVRSMAFSYDSTRLASTAVDRKIKVWDASTSECLSTLEGHSSLIDSVAFSHDSTQLASGSEDGTVKVWDASGGGHLSMLEGHSVLVHSVAFSHDSNRMASASGDGTVKVWDANSGECLSIVSHSRGTRSVAFSYDSTWLASGSWDRMVKVWDTSSGECLLTLEGHSDVISSIAFSHDSTWLASASWDNIIKVWDTSSGECLSTLEGHSDNVSLMAFSHDSTWLASASEDRMVKVWDASSGECLSTLQVGQQLRSISFDNSKSYLRTDIGLINISTSSSHRPILTNPEPQSRQYQGVALSADRVWITYNSENLVWLPTEYRPYCSVVSGNKLGIGVGNGRVLICEVHSASHVLDA